MKKLILMLALLLGLCAFAQAEETAAPAEAAAEATAEPFTDGNTEDPILAYSNDHSVYLRKSDLQADYDEMLEYYISMYAQYGYSMDEYDTDFQAQVAQYCAQSDLSKKIVEKWAADNGYVLSDERRAELTTEAENEIAQMRDYVKSMFQTYYGLTGDELETQADEYMAEMGYTTEGVVDSAIFSDLLDFVQDYATKDVVVTDEDVRASFDQKVAEEQTTYAEADAYIQAVNNGETVYWTPEGVRRVQAIYVANPETRADEERALGKYVTVPKIPAGLTKANAAREELLAGKDFAEVAASYDESGSDAETLNAGLLMMAGTTVYTDEIVNNAMALAAPGDVSEVFKTYNAYLVLRYLSDETAGTADYETVKDTERASVEETKKNEAYTNFVNNVIQEGGLNYNDLSPLYHVYVGESADKEISYAAPNGAQDILAAPNGAAVAKLAEGAVVDVLGHVTLDDAEWAFVAVPGTAVKGYIASANLTAAEAGAEDCSALLTKAEAAGEHPIFTIAMKDGQVIYGELYPETAPETVGNFIELAGSGFYDGLIFHRVIAGFMIQGGDPLSNGTGGPGYTIKGEFSENGVENGLSHTRGVLSMARSTDKDSGGSQFFIMHADSNYLDGNYAAFGLVLGGMDEVDAIASAPVDSNDKPRVDQTMRTVYVETFGKEYPFTKIPE